MKRYFFPLLLLFSVSVAHAWPAMVVRVSDGDTLTVRTEDGGSHRIRLYGVDSPEMNQDWGREARRAAFRLAINRLVEVQELYQDRYGRMVAVVVLPDGRVLQEVLLDGGMAWVDDRYCKLPVCEGWRTRMGFARTSRRGLWQEVYPFPPWEWRKARRMAARQKRRQDRAAGQD